MNTVAGCYGNMLPLRFQGKVFEYVFGPAVSLSFRIKTQSDWLMIHESDAAGPKTHSFMTKLSKGSIIGWLSYFGPSANVIFAEFRVYI